MQTSLVQSCYADDGYKRNPVVVLGVLVCLMCFNGNGGDILVRYLAVEKNFDYFNDRVNGRDALNVAVRQPFIFRIDGTINGWNNYGDPVDFVGLQNFGWSYSRIYKNELVFADGITSIFNIKFPRYITTDCAISTASAVYVRVRCKGV